MARGMRTLMNQTYVRHWCRYSVGGVHGGSYDPWWTLVHTTVYITVDTSLLSPSATNPDLERAVQRLSTVNVTIVGGARVFCKHYRRNFNEPVKLPRQPSVDELQHHQVELRSKRRTNTITAANRQLELPDVPDRGFHESEDRNTSIPAIDIERIRLLNVCDW